MATGEPDPHPGARKLPAGLQLGRDGGRRGRGPRCPGHADSVHGDRRLVSKAIGRFRPQRLPRCCDVSEAALSRDECHSRTGPIGTVAVRARSDTRTESGAILGRTGRSERGSSDPKASGRKRPNVGGRTGEREDQSENLKTTPGSFASARMPTDQTAVVATDPKIAPRKLDLSWVRHLPRLRRRRLVRGEGGDALVVARRGDRLVHRWPVRRRRCPGQPDRRQDPTIMDGLAFDEALLGWPS